jgi:ribosomal subunit interface protein
MQVQIRHDDNIQGSDRLSTIVTAAVEGGLDRFRDQITTVEVHLADENGPKSGGDDIRCTVEVRVEGRSPVAVKHHASDLEVAVEAAVEKMARMLDSQLGKQRERDRSSGNGNGES